MAKAIKQIEKIQYTSQEEQAQDIAVLMKQITENRESITTSLEILKELQQSGVLDILKGFLKTKEKVGAIALEQINQPSMHNIIKNGFNTIEFLGTLDPEKLKIILNGVSKGLDETSERIGKNEQVSLWGMVKEMRDPDVNMVLTSMFGFLNGMGKEIGKGRTH
ncbi:DUF1641 domain-containing protein [Bacillus sp. V3B]|uniref:DUF1641 domain-containing protein n=1 Tax=Bacillus sp. V3B TaxID=2804915 RepID=UPI00210E7D17|nr:DUF1641 domain-containing protein [Bacillus sp. V3B]MCQ6277559.1 DUF1641 domain-containing protein [Bacillus sp. V3B]